MMGPGSSCSISEVGTCSYNRMSSQKDRDIKQCNTYQRFEFFDILPCPTSFGGGLYDLPHLFAFVVRYCLLRFTTGRLSFLLRNLLFVVFVVRRQFCLWFPRYFLLRVSFTVVFIVIGSFLCLCL